MIFLKAFTKKMGFYEEDLENSLLAVEGFILENWRQLNHLRSGHDLTEISAEYLKRVKHTTDKNAMRINDELNKNTLLTKLLIKSKSELLSGDEERQLHNGLISVLKIVPTFVIIGLPISYLTLPMLLKILPQERP